MSKKLRFCLSSTLLSLSLLGLSEFASAQTQIPTLSGKIYNNSSRHLRLELQGGSTGSSWVLPVSPLESESSYSAVGVTPPDPKFPFIDAPFRIFDINSPANYCDFGIVVNSSRALEINVECTSDVHGNFGACTQEGATYKCNIVINP